MIAAAMPQHLPGVLHSLEPTLNQFGYLAVVGLVLIEDFGVPVPGETVLILAAVYAGSGRLNIVLVALLGFCGAVLGDSIGFAIGHFGGRRLAERYGRYIFLTPDLLGVVLVLPALCSQTLGAMATEVRAGGAERFFMATESGPPSSDKFFRTPPRGRRSTIATSAPDRRENGCTLGSWKHSSSAMCWNGRWWD